MEIMSVRTQLLITPDKQQSLPETYNFRIKKKNEEKVKVTETCIKH